jgi:23S rRNA (cytidine1920-2'-O)/16S rRNA (cytidine1409-2'-O)-methyltransferase
MPRRARLDAELVRRGLARSRGEARELVDAGRVQVRGLPATKPSTAVDAQTSMRLADDRQRYASRGAHKLAGALDAWPTLVVAGARCLDAGASTGGFTDVLLRRGAAQIVAVDVGYGQLAWRLRQDPRVLVRDRTNARALTAAGIGGPVQLAVADLSFISLRTVLPALIGCVRPDGDLIVLVKPQFEVGRGRVGPSGVVRSPEHRADAIRCVAATAHDLGLGVRGVLASELAGPAGNVEYPLWLSRGAPPLDPAELTSALETGDER